VFRDNAPVGVRRLFGRGDADADRGAAALARGDYEQAARAYEAAVVHDGTRASTWFNLGLAHKLRRDWRASMDANRRAAELDPRNDASFWNCGVAATALRDWSTARWAWRGIGLDPGEGVGPPEMGLGLTPVRLDPADVGEVVWGTRLDPCRVRIDNVPLPESGHRWRDVVLHDVVPHGTRLAWEREWAVFDELIRMDPTDEPTWEAEVTVPTDDDLDDIQRRLSDADLGVEDWSTVRLLCKRCSESSPHAHGSGDDPNPIRLVVRRFGFAGPRGRIERALGEWLEAGDGRAHGQLLEANVAGLRSAPDD
jgi:hypothetical protein